MTHQDATPFRSNLHWPNTEVDKSARRTLVGHGSAAIWLTGLSGAGKTTLANLVERQLHALGHHTYMLDGDKVRHGLSRDLGFSPSDRSENIRRVAEVSRMFVDAGIIVLVALISPFRAERNMARGLFSAGEFIEVFVDAPLSVAEQRDPKGLYRKARRGELRHFTGIDSPYEAPDAPEVHVRTDQVPPDQAAAQILHYLSSAGLLRNASEGTSS